MDYFNNRTEIVKKVEKLWEAEYKVLSDSLVSFYANTLRSGAFNDAVYNSELLEFTNYFGREFFKDISLVISSYQNIGTYESVINLIKGIFGEQVIVFFSGENMQDINVQSTASIEYPLDDAGGNPIVTTLDERIVAIDNRLDLQYNKIIEVLRL